MEMTIIETNKASAAIGPYSQAIAVNQIIFVSGQLGLIPESGETRGRCGCGNPVTRRWEVSNKRRKSHTKEICKFLISLTIIGRSRRV